MPHTNVTKCTSSSPKINQGSRISHRQYLANNSIGYKTKLLFYLINRYDCEINYKYSYKNKFK